MEHHAMKKLWIHVPSTMVVVITHVLPLVVLGSAAVGLGIS